MKIYPQLIILSILVLRCTMADSTGKGPGEKWNNTRKRSSADYLMTLQTKKVKKSAAIDKSDISNIITEPPRDSDKCADVREPIKSDLEKEIIVFEDQVSDLRDEVDILTKCQNSFNKLIAYHDKLNNADVRLNNIETVLKTGTKKTKSMMERNLENIQSEINYVKQGFIWEEHNKELYIEMVYQHYKINDLENLSRDVSKILEDFKKRLEDDPIFNSLITAHKDKIEPLQTQLNTLFTELEACGPIKRNHISQIINESEPGLKKWRLEAKIAQLEYDVKIAAEELYTISNRLSGYRNPENDGGLEEKEKKCNKLYALHQLHGNLGNQYWAYRQVYRGRQEYDELFERYRLLNRGNDILKKQYLLLYHLWSKLYGISNSEIKSSLKEMTKLNSDLKALNKDIEIITEDIEIELNSKIKAMHSTIKTLKLEIEKKLSELKIVKSTAKRESRSSDRNPKCITNISQTRVKPLEPSISALN